MPRPPLTHVLTTAFAVILITCLAVVVFQPSIVLGWLIYTIVSVFVAHLMAREGDVIDIGMTLWKPIAKFGIGTQEFIIHPLPGDAIINEHDRRDVTAISAGTALALAFVCWVLVIRLDGIAAPADSVTTPHRSLDGTNVAVAKITGIVSNSSAARAGLMTSDLILSADGAPSHDLVALVALLRQLSSTTLEVESRGNRRRITVTRSADAGGLFGFTLSPALAFRDSVDVTAVRFRGLAYRLGLRPGDRLALEPKPPYMSESLVLREWDRAGFQTLVAYQSAGAWLGLGRESTSPRVIRIRPTMLDSTWSSSLDVQAPNVVYHPPLRDSLKLAAAAGVVCLPISLSGEGLRVRPFPRMLAGTDNRPSRLLRRVLLILTWIAAVLLFSMAVATLFNVPPTTGVLAALGCYVAVQIVCYFARPAAVDVSMLWLTRQLPFGSFMFSWDL